MFRVSSLGCRALALGFGVSSFWVEGFGLSGLGFGALGLGFRA